MTLASADGEPVRFTVDRRTGELTVEGTSKSAPPWLSAIQALDGTRLAAGEDARLVSFRQQARGAIRRAAEALMPASGESQAAGLRRIPPVRGNAAPRWAGDFVSMIFQPKGAAAPEEPAAGGAQPVDPAAPPPAGQPMPLNPLGQPDGEPGEAVEGDLIGPVQIEFLEDLDIVIIRGHKRDVERVIQIINEIERLSAATQPAVEIYPLKHVDGQAMATLITQIYDQALGARQGRVNITPLVKPNALLLVGRPESVRAVIELIERLDQPVLPSAQFRVFQLANASALDVETTMRSFFLDQTGLSARVRIVSDYRSNALIVQASPRDMAEVQRFVNQLDVAASAALNEVRVFRLRNTLAVDLAPVIQSAISAQTTRGTTGAIPGQQQQPQPGDGQVPGAAGQQGRQFGTPRSANLTFMKFDAQGQRLLRSGILLDVRVTADPRANAVVVTGPAEGMELIAALIEQLDQLPEAEAQIKVFTIVNGDATSLATMLQTLFGQPAGAQGGGLQSLLQTATGQGDSTLVPLRISVDQRTNSIIVSGSVGDLNVVEAILLRLDESDIRQRQSVVYRLQNAPATDVANAINEFLRSERQVQQIVPESVSPFEQIEREVVVVPEPVSNSLIISATPRYFEEVKRIVLELDARPPMVLIQVLIAEVSLRDVDELGFEWGLQDSLLFDRSVLTDIATPGFAFAGAPLGNAASAASLATRNNVGTQGTSTFGVGRTNGELGYGGLVLSASSDSVSVLIRALQDSRRLRILSRPQVMTLDNQPAFVQVGSRVPRITSTQITETGTINNTVLENVGIILGVTPRISPDGLVVMEIDAEKSELGPEAEGIPISINANGDVIRSPQIRTTVAQTTVSGRSGQTVILGGLITSSKSIFQRRVPIISSAPVVGRLFRFDSETESRSELLIIMTPYIVRSDDDVTMLNRMEMDRMSWCLADVLKIHGDPGLGIFEHGYMHGPEIVYPDRDPTGGERLPTPAARPGTKNDVLPEPDARNGPSLLHQSGSRRHAMPPVQGAAGPGVAAAYYDVAPTPPGAPHAPAAAPAAWNESAPPDPWNGYLRPAAAADSRHESIRRLPPLP
jgi:general secretion pathway protein D